MGVDGAVAVLRRAGPGVDRAGGSSRRRVLPRGARRHRCARRRGPRPRLITPASAGAAEAPPSTRPHRYAVAAMTLTKIGSHDLALVAADRAWAAARRCDDLADVGMAVYQVVCALLPSPRSALAEELAATSAAQAATLTRPCAASPARSGSSPRSPPPGGPMPLPPASASTAPEPRLSVPLEPCRARATDLRPAR